MVASGFVTVFLTSEYNIRIKIQLHDTQNSQKSQKNGRCEAAKAFFHLLTARKRKLADVYKSADKKCYQICKISCDS